MDNRGLQGLVGFVGITFGLLPLVQYLLAGTIGLWRFVVGEQPALPWLYPVLALVVAGGLVAMLETRRRARGGRV